MDLEPLTSPVFAPLWVAQEARQHRYLGAHGGRGCVHPDTPIDTPLGQIKISEFHGGPVWSWWQGRLVWAEAGSAREFSTENLYDVELDDGRVITATDQHKFLTHRGWVMLCDLRDDDLIVTQRQRSADDLQEICSLGAQLEWRASVPHWTQIPANCQGGCSSCRRQCGLPPQWAGDSARAFPQRQGGEQQRIHHALTCSDGLGIACTGSLSPLSLHPSTWAARALGVAQCCEGLGSHTAERTFGQPLAFCQCARQCLQMCGRCGPCIEWYALHPDFGTQKSLAQNPQKRPDMQLYGAQNSLPLQASFVLGSDFTLTRPRLVRYSGRQTYWDLHVYGTNNYLSDGIVNHNSGKSWDRALGVVVRMVQEETRVACVREVQKSLKDSVHQLIVDTIKREGLESQFEITERAIRNILTGSYSIFMGLRDQSAEGIKSLEGMDIAWIEEAQSITNRSLEVLRPTIRKPKSQIWATWNPRFRHDPIDRLLRQNKEIRKEAVVVKANWDANLYFTAELERERQLDLATNPDRYQHIWEGAYETESDVQFITGALVEMAKQAQPYATMEDPCLMGVDVARYGDDRSTIYLRRGNDARTMGYFTYQRISTMELVGRVTELAERFMVDQIFVDETGVGGGVVDRLRQMNYENVIGVNFGSSSDHYVNGLPKAANKRAEIWIKMREHLRSGLAIPDSEELEQDLIGPLYSFDIQNRVLLEKKDDMKKRGISSPDVADALALTYSYTVVARAIQRREEQRQMDEFDPIWSSL